MVDETTVGNAVKPYGVSNPHPGYGKDKNVANEFGHTHYPKYVKNADGVNVIVNNAAEEAEIAVEQEPSAKKPKGWK